ncbi:Protein slit [Eumeta japonica]|uniref:Protein slit n=1 Tax=Eumeta variegata TaxID=151549 RepID=A0A4C1VPF0_EUMVA|nr:Protein slit [Eumeta japonica]
MGSLVMRAGAEGPACEAFVDDSNTFTVNCTRRDLKEVPSQWPEEVSQINDGDHVLLTFYNNSITNLTTLPPILGGRIAISFKSNKLIEIEDNTFENIAHMVYLDLSNNMITGQVLRSEIFQGPYSKGVYGDIALETLNLGHNKIHSLDRYLFKHTPNISRLYLNNNPIKILDHVTVLALSTAINLQVHLRVTYKANDVLQHHTNATKENSTVQPTKLCRSGLRANDAMRGHNAPRSFLLLVRVPILRNCDDFVTNFIAAEFLHVSMNTLGCRSRMSHRRQSPSAVLDSQLVSSNAWCDQRPSSAQSAIKRLCEGTYQQRGDKNAQHIASIVFKICAAKSAPILTHLFRHSYSFVIIVPDSWKIVLCKLNLVKFNLQRAQLYAFTAKKIPIPL